MGWSSSAPGATASSTLSERRQARAALPRSLNGLTIGELSNYKFDSEFTFEAIENGERVLVLRQPADPQNRGVAGLADGGSRAIAFDMPKRGAGFDDFHDALIAEHARGAPRLSLLARREREGVGRGEPVAVLGDWHLPLTGVELADFARSFPTLRYEVRVPTLDDLFMKLSLEP